jgi:hypothetical protein
MNTSSNAVVSNSNEDIFVIDLIEENGVSEDMLCNTLGCS